MQLYIENILALEAKAQAAGRGTGRPLPLAIMTSDDTHAATQQLLAEHGHFGAKPEQVHLLKQEKV
jgi:UDP-sugar pyrophosphorylase